MVSYGDIFWTGVLSILFILCVRACLFTMFEHHAIKLLPLGYKQGSTSGQPDNKVLEKFTSMCIEPEIQKEMIYEFCGNDLTPMNDDVSVT